MSLWQMSFSGAVLISVIVLLRALLINRLPKRTFLILWGIALARLLLPISVPSVLSVYNTSIDADISVWEAVPDASTAVSTSMAEAYASAVGGEVSDFMGTDIFPVDNTDTGVILSRQESIPETVTKSLKTGGISAYAVWTLLWGVGAVLCGMLFVSAYVRCRLEFRMSLPVSNPFVEEWLKEAPLRYSITGKHLLALHRKVVVRQSDRITAPLTYGALSPVILLPKRTDWENTQELSYILLHEYVHICRWDAVRKLISTAALCLHWFNPAVWILYILFNRDIELVCDECVVRQYGENTKSLYARMLICMEEKKSGLTPLCNNFSRTAIEGRIKAIMKMKKASIGTVAIAGALIIGVTAAFATSAMGKEKTPATIAGTEFSEEELEKLLVLQDAALATLARLTRQWGSDNPELFAEYSVLPLENLSRPDTPEEWEKEEKALLEQALAEREAQWAEILAPYLPFGITCRYDAETDNYRLYYEGKEVRGLCDEREGVWISEHAGISTYEEGALELYAVYDETGRLTGLRAATEEEQQAWTDIRSANTASLTETAARRND